MINWWIDIDDNVVRAQVDLKVFSRPEITFEGTDAKFLACKKFTYGSSYVYDLEGHTACVNVVKSRGEKFVSLYLDNKLIKEYNVCAQKYSQIYNSLPNIFDSKKKFAFKFLLPKVLVSALVLAVLLTAIACLTNIAPDYNSVFSMFMIVCSLNLVWMFLLGLILFAMVRTRLRRYEIISSIVKRKKKKKKKRVRRFY